MNDCMDTEVRDALPDLIHGRLSDLDKATLTAHVESCADCRAELEFLSRLRAAAPLAPRIDIERIVSALPVPMPSAADVLASVPSRAARNSRRSFIWKTAAAAALLVVGSLTFANGRRQSLPVSVINPTASAAAVAEATIPVAPSVASLPSERVATPRLPAAVPGRAVATAGRAGLSLTGGVQDLTDQQLQALVNDLDKVKGLPSAEPEAVTIGVDENEGLQ